jgi:REP element-mobilizing transposase RayT
VPASDPKSSTEYDTQSDADSSGDAKNRRGKHEKGAAKAGSNVHFEPLERQAYEMSYACLLIPRNDEHLLTGKVPEFLQKAIKDACQVFGWRLDFIQVRPEYLQWVVSATVGTPPSRCIHMIREQTSKGILDKYRQFRDKKNPIRDFWAPGYLVLVGSAPHPPEIVQEFIRLTRGQQGLTSRGG